MLPRSLILFAALFAASSAAPMPRPDDSAIGEEIPVSAPNGIPMSDPVTSTDSSQADATMNDKSAKATSVSMDDKSAKATSASMDDMGSKTMSSADAMATDSASAAAATYGSGSSSWGGSGYDSCVQQCAASYGQPAMTWTPPSATQASSSGGSSGGSGVTHTVIVAPTQGVLRYIPFSTNASVGDTVLFHWGAGPHTVTQSSALTVCNKTSAPGAFASGIQNKSFEFSQVINDTKPIWYYCGIPGHCQKGMFGGINIGQADPTGSDSTGSEMGSSDNSTDSEMGSSNSTDSEMGSSNSTDGSSGSSSSYVPLGSVMANMTSMSSDMSALWSYTKNQTAGNAYANGWGLSTNCAGMSQDAMMQTAQNVMYMQTLIAVNPNSMKDGKFAVTDANSLTIPQDLHAALSSSSASATSTTSAAAGSTASAGYGGAAAAAASSPASTPPKNSNGAGSLASSTIVVGVVAVVATFFAL